MCPNQSAPADLIIVDCDEAKQKPQIAEFVDLVDQTAGAGGVLHQNQFQDAAFVKYWSNSMIAVLDELKDDFKFLFFGTELVSLHGRELTGKFLSEMGLRTTEDTVRQLNANVIENRTPIFSSGRVDIMHEDFKKWWHVKLPFERNDGIPSTLTYVVFQ